MTYSHYKSPLAGGLVLTHLTRSLDRHVAILACYNGSKWIDAHADAIDLSIAEHLRQVKPLPWVGGRVIGCKWCAPCRKIHRTPCKVEVRCAEALAKTQSVGTIGKPQIYHL